MNPSTFLRVLGPEPWNVAYVTTLTNLSLWLLKFLHPNILSPVFLCTCLVGAPKFLEYKSIVRFV